MDVREFKFLINLKKDIRDKIKVDELYQQRELLELLGISAGSFRKYFSSDEEWDKNAKLEYGKRKFYKGSCLRMKILNLVSDEWYERFKEDKVILDEILDKYKDFLEVEIRSYSSDEYEIEDYLLHKYLPQDELREEQYWTLRLHDKIDDL